MKAKILFFLWSVLCLISYGVSFAAFYRFEFYTMAFFWMLSLIFAVLTLVEYLNMKTTDV
ncbi:MAG: hypothetical protein E7605_04055 [Ruminococcaceae bacterium]|nr:hypothetical protein [Oscillospiraceae bacterium]